MALTKLSGSQIETPVDISAVNLTGVTTAQSLLVVGSGLTSGTSNQPLQVTGGAYVSESVAIGRTNALSSSKLHVLGGVLLHGGDRNTETTPSYGGLWAYFDSVANTYHLTAINASESALALSTKPDSSTATQERLRISSTGNVGIGTSTNIVGQLQVANGPVIIGSATSTGTTLQPLQVSGGAYVSNYVAIGVTAISNTKHVLQGVGTTSALYDPNSTNASNPLVYFRNNDTTAGTDVTIRLDANGSATTAATTISAISESTGGNSALAFGTRSGGGTIIEKVRITSTGAVGIGTTNPVSTANLQINPASSSNVVVLTSIGGSFGIGTTNPNRRLTVVGDARFVQGSQGAINITHSTVGSLPLVTSMLTESAIDLALGTTNAENIRIVASSGNVGIGTTTAASRLEVRHTSAEIARFYRSGADAGRIRLGSSRGSHGAPTALSSGDHAGVFTFDAHDGTSFTPAASILATLNAAPSTNNVQGRLSIFCNPGSSTELSNEVIRVTHAANVGIGTNNLSSISANVATVTLGSIISATSGGITYQTAPATSRAYHYFDNDRMIHQSTKRHAFLVNNSNIRMVINESGDTIIGTGATNEISNNLPVPLQVTTSNYSSPTDTTWGGIYSYNGAQFYSTYIAGGSDNDTSSACTFILPCSSTPSPFAGTVVISGNSTSGGTVRGSLYLIKGEVITTAGTAAIQNSAVTAVAGDTASTSCSLSGTSLSSGNFIAVKVTFNSGASTNQNAGGVSLTTYNNVRRATREP